MSLILQGAGEGATLIAGDGSCKAALMATAGETLTVADLSITNGRHRAVALENATATFADVTISDSGSRIQEGGAVYIIGGVVSFEGCTLADNIASAGGSLFAVYDVDLSLTDTTVTGSAAIDGGGIFLGYETGHPSALHLANVTVTDNTAEQGGAGVYVDDWGALDSSQSVYTDNTGVGVRGGGIYASADATLVSTDDTFQSNGATEAGTTGTGGGHSAGGAVFLEEGDALTVEGGTWSDNFATEGGAIGAFGTAEIAIADTTFQTNQAYDSGGAIYGPDAMDLSISGSTFSANAAQSGAGGALYDGMDGNLTVQGSTFTADTAAQSGGAVSLPSAINVSFAQVDFQNNTSDQGNGGAVAIGAALAVTLDQVGFDYNQAESDSTDSGAGGGLYLDAVEDVLASDLSFEGNYAQAGGALYTTESAVALSRSTFFGNAAGAPGGGGAWSSVEDEAVTVTASTFQRNTAAPTADGGALLLHEPGNLAVSDSLFCGNTSGQGGAAVDHQSLARPAVETWRDNVFEENSARIGGALYLVEGTAAFAHNVFVGNEALNGGGVELESHSTAVFSDSIFAWTQDGDGVVDLDTSVGTFTYTDWYENNTEDAGGTLTISTTSDGNTASDPGFVAYTLDGNCGNDNLHLAAGSSLVDAGDPTMTDPDGSPSDIGLEATAIGDVAGDTAGDTAADTGGPGPSSDKGGRSPGCGCATAGAPDGLGLAILALVGGVGLRRRRPPSRLA